MRCLILPTIVMMLTLTSPVLAGGKQIRDRNGRLIETWRQQRAGHVEVRDRNGALKEIRKRHGNKIIIRDRNGRLLRVETID